MQPGVTIVHRRFLWRGDKNCLNSKGPPLGEIFWNVILNWQNRWIFYLGNNFFASKTLFCRSYRLPLIHFFAANPPFMPLIIGSDLASEKEKVDNSLWHIESLIPKPQNCPYTETASERVTFLWLRKSSISPTRPETQRKRQSAEYKIHGQPATARDTNSFFAANQLN
jgi:hypothetical protein